VKGTLRRLPPLRDGRSVPLKEIASPDPSSWLGVCFFQAAAFLTNRVPFSFVSGRDLPLFLFMRSPSSFAAPPPSTPFSSRTVCAIEHFPLLGARDILINCPLRAVVTPVRFCALLLVRSFFLQPPLSLSFREGIPGLYFEETPSLEQGLYLLHPDPHRRPLIS